MERINFSDIGTDDAKVKVFNNIIDNLNLVEDKVCVIDAQQKEFNRKAAAKAKAAAANKTKGDK